MTTSTALLVLGALGGLFASLAHFDARSGPGSLLTYERATRIKVVSFVVGVIAACVGASLKIGGF
jgi:hypothetical protein